MPMTWISVPLTIEEKEALHTLADMEFRNSRLQAAMIIRAELERRGFISYQSNENHSDERNSQPMTDGS
jgi:hypothetical protein